MDKTDEAKCAGGGAVRRVRMRRVKKRVKVKVLYRTWWRGGSGTRLVRCEEGWESRIVEVRVPVRCRRMEEAAQ